MLTNKTTAKMIDGIENEYDANKKLPMEVDVAALKSATLQYELGVLSLELEELAKQRGEMLTNKTTSHDNYTQIKTKLQQEHSSVDEVLKKMDPPARPELLEEIKSHYDKQFAELETQVKD